MGCFKLHNYHLDNDLISGYTPKLDVVRDFLRVAKLDVATKKEVLNLNTKYYPYGMLMPGRFGEVANSSYTYGFNGMEKDDEVKGSGNSYTTQFRSYDPRLGRWLSVDPLASSFAWQSPYVSFDNKPILMNDPSGLAAEGEDTDDWFMYQDKEGDSHVVWDNESGEEGCTINRCIDGVERELTNIGKSISILTTSDIREPNDILIPGVKGTKMATSYEIEGVYGENGFSHFKSNFRRKNGATFGLLEGSATADGKMNSEIKMAYNNDWLTNIFYGSGVYGGGFDQHTQVHWLESSGLKEYSGGNIVDVNQLVLVLLKPMNSGLLELSITASHGTFPSVMMELQYGKSKSLMTIYRYQQLSFGLTHGSDLSAAYMYSMTGAGADAIKLWKNMNNDYKGLSPIARFGIYTAGLKYVNLSSKPMQRYIGVDD